MRLQCSLCSRGHVHVVDWRGVLPASTAPSAINALSLGHAFPCSPHFQERLEELGAVDSNGMNFKKLNAIRPPWYKCLG